MNTDVLSTRQVATLLGVGEATVKRWADAGEIDCFRTPGGHRKFRLRDVTAFVSRRQYQTSGPLPDGVPPGADEPGEPAIEYFQASALRGNASGMVAQLAGLRRGGQELSGLSEGWAGPRGHGGGGRWRVGACRLAGAWGAACRACAATPCPKRCAGSAPCAGCTPTSRQPAAERLEFWSHLLLSWLRAVGGCEGGASSTLVEAPEAPDRRAFLQGR